jgi:hypothetical protein
LTIRPRGQNPRGYSPSLLTLVAIADPFKNRGSIPAGCLRIVSLTACISKAASVEWREATEIKTLNLTAVVSRGRERLDSKQVPDRLDGTNLGLRLAEYSEMAGIRPAMQLYFCVSARACGGSL